VFLDKLHAAKTRSMGSLCVGLDPHADRIPERFGSGAEGGGRFLDWVIDETASHACAFKPNAAFFEVWGDAGWRVLRRVVRRAQETGAPVILDAKRGDIASTARAYATAVFEELKADAVTVVPYMGEDAVLPFLEAGGFAFVLTLPTNPSAEWVVDHGDPPIYLRVGELTRRLSERFPGQLGMVVGATRPKEAVRLHALAPGLPWLVPGIGAQGGDMVALRNAIGAAHPMLVNVSRAVIFDAQPRIAAERTKARIKEVGG